MRFRRRGSAEEPRGSFFARSSLGDPADALAEADRLVAAGRAGEAVRFLTQASRRQRDPGVERRLVELRFEAFQPAPGPARRPRWPDTVDDLFPGECIPEVAAENLTVELLRSAVMCHGSLLVRGLANRSQVERLIGDIDKSFAAFDAVSSGAPRADHVGWFEQCTRVRARDRRLKRAAGGVFAVDSPSTLFDLIETLDTVGIGRLVRDYFGELPMLLAKKTTLRRVCHDANTGDWHQDGAFMGEGIRSLNVWLSLSRCGDDAPGMDVVGRRLDNLVESSTGGGFFNWSIGSRAVEQAAAGAIVRPIFEPGDALLFDHLCVHRTAVDVDMTKDRYAIETWLFAPSTYDAMTTSVDNGYSPRDQLPILY